jgi:hypothetical protein
MARKLEGYERWMYPDRIDPNFGVAGSSQEDYIRKSYRRLASSNLFNPLPQGDVSLNELHRPMPAPSRKFVLVEEARLEELSKFENVLRDEKSRLGEQAAWLLSDTDTKACVPTPATRLAIHNVCETEMRSLAAKIHKLNEEWGVFYKKNHYDRPPVYLKNSFVENAPLGMKAQKLLMMKDASIQWRTRKDRDTMLYEDEQSYLVQAYTDAHERRQDYDRYFVLATRYGHWAEEVFYKDNRPGLRYFKRVMKAVRNVQRLWGSFWAVRRIKLFRGARALQTIFRGWFAYKWNYPVIKMRLKIGKRTYYIFCWTRWMEYLELVKELKTMIRRARFKPARLAYAEWKAMWVEAQTGRVAVMRRFVKRMQNAGLAMCFSTLKNYTLYRRNIKSKVKRWLSGYFTFDVWIQHTKWRRYMRKLGNASTTLSAGYRGMLARRAFYKKRNALYVLIRFSIIIKHWVAVASKRRKFLDRQFITWHDTELTRRISVAATNERNRGHRMQMMVGEKEKAAAALLRRHLRGKSGKIQLKQEAKRFVGMESKGKSAFALARSDLIQRCVGATRMYECHNFDTTYPPVHVCADAGCGTIFTDDEQYHRHLSESPRHRGAHQNWSGFHMMLKNKVGKECINTFIIEKHGFGELNHCVDLWSAIAHWKCTPTDSKGYLEQFIEIYDTFLAGRQATHQVDLHSTIMPHFDEGFAGRSGTSSKAVAGAKPYGDNDIENMLAEVKAKVNEVRVREFEDDFFCERVADQSILRTITFRPPARYEAWTDQNVVDPKLLDHIAFICFLKIFNTFGPDPCPTNMPMELMMSREGEHLHEAQREASTVSPWGDEAEARFDLCNCEGVVEWRRDRVIPVVAGDPAYAASNFYNSPFIVDYRAAQVKSERNGKMLLFQDMCSKRLRDFKNFADEYKEHDTACVKASWKAVDQCFEPLLNEISHLFIAEEMAQEIFRRSYLEQEAYEPQGMKAVEAVDWAEIDLFEEFWTFFVPSMLMSMLEVEGFRKGMLEYAGMIKLQLKKTLQIDMSRKNEGKEWFDAFFSEAAEMADEVAPSLTERAAARRIQKHIRGVLGRKKARIAFTACFTKRYDATEELCYYTNEATGETSWDPPKIIKYIWPGRRF